jgi:hypothetical protein
MSEPFASGAKARLGRERIVEAKASTYLDQKQNPAAHGDLTSKISFGLTASG